MANAKGIAKELNPASRKGGWMSMPPSRRIGFKPRPSAGVISSRSKGLATKTRTARKKVRWAVSDAPMPTSAWSGKMAAAGISSTAKPHMTRLRRSRAQVSTGL